MEVRHLKIDGKTELLGVFGCPVSHTKSPAMHNALFEALGINAVYVPLPATKENFASAVGGLVSLGFRGANATIPFKDVLADFACEVSEISKFTKSANTLYWKDGEVGGTLCATTTDPLGALKNLEQIGVEVAGKEVAMLGNGGAAAAISFALLERGARLTIVCRNEERGRALTERLGAHFPEAIPDLKTFQNFDSAAPDIILNTTPVGMTPHDSDTPLPGAKFRPGQTVYDIIYTPPKTRLLQDAEAAGCKILNGEGMLVYQGLASFRLWFPRETANLSDDFLASVMKRALEDL